MFPEYTWVNAVQYASPMLDRRQLSEAFWQDAFPRLKAELCVPGKTAILGSVPRLDGGRLYNTCPVFTDGRVLLQDKLALTPWEEEFTGGAEINIFKIGDLSCAVLICLDVEMPDLAQALKASGGLDVLFVPSATETMMGVERIARCATARSVELGCAVVTSGLTGAIADYPFIDANFGRAALYLPSLTGLEDVQKAQETAVETAGGTAHRFTVEDVVFKKSKARILSTNPALITATQKITVNKTQKA
jgi:predicted amidohydrolase